MIAGQEYDGNDACNQHIASAHDATHAAALACMLLSQHDDAGYRADNAHAEQHPLGFGIGVLDVLDNRSAEFLDTHVVVAHKLGMIHVEPSPNMGCTL